MSSAIDDINGQPSTTTSSTDPLTFVEKLQKNWAKGQRLAFFTSHITGYTAAVVEGHSRAAEYLDTVLNSYFQRFHWKLKVSEEPDAPFEPERSPLEEKLTAMEAEQKKAEDIAIRAWFDYRVKTVKKSRRRSKGDRDPWSCLLAQLSGVSKSKPKALQPQQRWSKDHFETVVRKDFEERWAEQGKSGKHKAAFRTLVTREHFEKTSREVQKEYKKLAKSEGKAAVEKWREDLTVPPSAAAVDRHELGSFAGPILAGMHKILGMHVSLLVGGPEPRKDGQINVLCMHEGGDNSPQPQNWQQYDKKKFKAVTALFQDYLSTCYSAEEREKRKLTNVDTTNAPYVISPTPDDDEQSDTEVLPSTSAPSIDPKAKPKAKRQRL
ncbi:hypothetical protein BJ138DRAFT_1105784 [Hygrophoropsis aurantiaca]|uniref:Uncharacterized protein n=1 Tax=Hygrophoropsis aurantiaca TaxID=72124 RepID=A0ACB7ZYE7_9AGAM|nr:hypothetical protein BJ138DRAFT_1105784 [Hygrophoropsis aurantiaca]